MDFSVTNAIPILAANAKNAQGTGKEESFLDIIAGKLVNTADKKTIEETPSANFKTEGMNKESKRNTREAPQTASPAEASGGNAVKETEDVSGGIRTDGDCDSVRQGGSPSGPSVLETAEETASGRAEEKKPGEGPAGNTQADLYGVILALQETLAAGSGYTQSQSPLTPETESGKTPPLFSGWHHGAAHEGGPSEPVLSEGKETGEGEETGNPTTAQAGGQKEDQPRSVGTGEKSPQSLSAETENGAARKAPPASRESGEGLKSQKKEERPLPPPFAAVTENPEEDETAKVTPSRMVEKNPFFAGRTAPPPEAVGLPEEAKAGSAASRIPGEEREFPGLASKFDAIKQSAQPASEGAAGPAPATGEEVSGQETIESLILSAAEFESEENAVATYGLDGKMRAATNAKESAETVKTGIHATYRQMRFANDGVATKPDENAEGEGEEQFPAAKGSGVKTVEGPIALSGWRLWQKTDAQKKTDRNGSAEPAPLQKPARAGAEETGVEKASSEQKPVRPDGEALAPTPKKSVFEGKDIEDRVTGRDFAKMTGIPETTPEEKTFDGIPKETHVLPKAERAAGSDTPDHARRGGEPSETDPRLAREVARQVLAGLRVSFLKRGDHAVINLKPESLGKIRIDLMRTEEGITARFRVESQEAKDALGSQIAQLKESIEGRGVNLAGVQVELGNDGSGRPKPGNAQKKKNLQQRTGPGGKDAAAVDNASAAAWRPWGFETRV